MLGLILGAFTIFLGIKAFSEDGIPLTRDQNLKGSTAKAIGVGCILLGSLFIIGGIWSVIVVMGIGK